MEQYFRTLQLRPNASIEEVKRAYKHQVKIWHPDKFPAESPRLQMKAHKMFQKITSAYKIICDAHNNHKYTGDLGWDGNRTKKTPDTYSKKSESLHGFETRTWTNGDKYEGQIFHDKMHGMGVFTSSQGYVYTGEFKHGKPNGLGKLVYDNGDQYEGSLFNDMLHGKGKYIYANGDRYQGEFQNDLPHGHGIYILANGNNFSGLWENGRLTS
jgi:hypothetical protein